MGFNNIIAIVGDKFDTINLITSKLVLLRDLDKVVDTDIENAVDFLNKTMPNVIIMHAKSDDTRCLDTLCEIKKQDILKTIPVLIYSEDCTKEFLIDAFDAGASDIVKSPLVDWELLIRVIWCIQKSEISVNIESRTQFLNKLGIVQEKTGFYEEKYAEQYLTNEIDQAIKYKKGACLMLVSPDNKFPPVKNEGVLSAVIKKSIRLNDSVAIAPDNKYYIFLPKTKLNGVYAVFERINNNLGIDMSVNAGVVEIKDKTFAEIKSLLVKTLEKTKDNTNTLLVAHELLPEVKHTPAGNVIFPINPKENKIQENMPVSLTDLAAINKTDETDDDEEERNASFFRQAYKKKCSIVVEPVFDKYALSVETSKKGIKVNKKVDFTISTFKLEKGNTKMLLTINYGGFSKVNIVTEIYIENEKKGFNSFDVNLTDFGFQKLSITLDGLIKEYMGYLK